MTKEDIIYNNELIAEFLGGVQETIPKGGLHGYKEGTILWSFLFDNNNKDAVQHLEFDSNWNWLIPVIDKIESLDLSPYYYSWTEPEGEEYNNFRFIEVEISRNNCCVWVELELDPPKLVSGSYEINDKTKLENTYKAVVEFIDYYNDLIKRKTHTK